MRAMHHGSDWTSNYKSRLVAAILVGYELEQHTDDEAN